MDKHLSFVDNIARQAVVRVGTSLVGIGRVESNPCKGRNGQNVGIVEAGTAIVFSKTSVEIAAGC